MCVWGGGSAVSSRKNFFLFVFFNFFLFTLKQIIDFIRVFFFFFPYFVVITPFVMFHLVCAPRALSSSHDYAPSSDGLPGVLRAPARADCL